MKWVVVPIVVALSGPALAADDLTICAGIEGAVERLDCYDRLAREQADTNPAAGTGAAGEPAPRPAATPQPRPESSPEVDVRIVAVRRSPLGEHIVTLSNGQVWVENEPGRRRIAPDQPVTIRKGRFHYEMELPAQPDVAVHRVR